VHAASVPHALRTLRSACGPCRLLRLALAADAWDESGWRAPDGLSRGRRPRFGRRSPSA